MFNGEYGDSKISKLLQFLTLYNFVLISLVVNIDLRSQSQCSLLTYPF